MCSKFLLSMSAVKLFIDSVDNTSSPHRAGTVGTCRGRTNLHNDTEVKDLCNRYFKAIFETGGPVTQCVPRGTW